MTVVIAVDGPAASGKGTLSKWLAEHFGFDHLDTGLLYRAVGVISGASGRDPAEVAAALTPADLEQPGLRSAGAGEAASVVAALPAVRERLLEFQRNLAASPPGGQGIVIDGRDIGTVICPNADVKLFITATAGERAGRRHRELDGRGEDVSFDTVLRDIRSRDKRDSERETAPLMAAADAVQIDTTELDIEAACAAALAACRARLGG
ncbi:MAG: d(CMP) kinase [Rhodospirillales bacterium]